MSKIAVITDTNSGMSAEDAAKYGIHLLSMPFIIGGETYLDGVDLTHEQFYEFLEKGAEISTSQPTPDSVTGMWDELLKEYDEIVHIPMSSGLSGSCQSAMMLAEDYDGRVQVVNNQRIAPTQTQSAIDAVGLVEQGRSAAEIKEILERAKFDSSIYIMLDTLYYLKKGGRITPAAAALGTILRLKPVLQIQGEKLDAFAKARTVGNAKSVMINAIMDDCKNRFDGMKEPGDVYLGICYTKNVDAAMEFKKEVMEQFPGYEPKVSPLSLSVACHIGPGALALAVSRKLEEL